MNKLKYVYEKIRQQSLDIVKNIYIEDFVVQTSYDVSPLKWHLGHTTWFFENLICKIYVKNFRPYHDKYNYIFNSYYNTLGDRVSKDLRGTLSRPTVNEILDYRKYIDSIMLELLEKGMDFYD